MSIGLLAALASALLAATPARQAERTTPHEAFDRGRTAFGRAEYRRAIELLHPLLYPEVLLDSEGEVVQAHRILGVSYLFSGQSEEAKREFHKLLELRPDYRFDPLLDPQQVVDAFNAVVKEEESEIVAIEARRKRRDQEIAARLQREARLHPPSHDDHPLRTPLLSPQLRPLRGGPVPERPARQRLAVLRRRDGAGGHLGRRA